MKKGLTSRFIIVIALFLGAIGVNSILASPEAAVKRTTLQDFPRSIGEWTMVNQQTMDQQSLEVLKVDDYIMRNYRNPSNQTIGLYIGYFASQREGKGSHSPRQCLPGAGWNQVETTVYELPPGFRDAGGTAFANKFLMGKGDQKQLYVFWYQGRGRTYASEYLNKAYLVADGLVKRRSDGALVRINVDGGVDAGRAFEVANGFIKQMAPVIGQFIPE